VETGRGGGEKQRDEARQAQLRARMKELKSTMSVVIYSSMGVWRPANRGVLPTASNALFELAGVGRDGDLDGSRQNLRRRAPNACCLVVLSPYCVIRLFILFSFKLSTL
jgi:hypothetical protein